MKHNSAGSSRKGIRGLAYPVADAPGVFTPGDFAEVIAQLPDGCPVVGGQAVAWWAMKYGITAGSGNHPEPVTSADIDFWGSREDLKRMAQGLDRRPVFPKEYEMTVWVGAIPLNIQGHKTLAEFLHTIPGLDTNDPDKASIEQEYKSGSVRRLIQILSPVSLVLSKLHALRHFDQADRQDELHLKVSLQASRGFIAQLLRQHDVREALWNCERLIAAHQMKPYRKLETQYQFNILDAVPIDQIRQAAGDQGESEDNRQRLANFVNLRWLRL